MGLPNQGEFVFAPTPPCFITQNNSENVPVNTTTNGFDGFSGFSDDAMDKDYDDDDDDEDDFAGIDLSAYDIIDDVNANVLPPLPLPPPPISTATTTATTANLETEILVFLETHGGKSTAEIKQALIQYSSPDQTTITTAAMIETTISNVRNVLF